MKSLKLLRFSFLIALLLGASSLFAQDPPDPINTLDQPDAIDCGIYEVDLRTQQYIDIANISMTLNLGDLAVPGSAPTWDPSHTVGTFASGPLKKITLHSSIAGLPWTSVYINAAGELKLSWHGELNFITGEQESFTLPDNTVLWTLEFDINGMWGTAHNLEWNDVLTINCELSGPGGVPIYNDYWNNLLWVIQNQLSLSHTKVDFECPFNGQKGSINLTVHGGIPPYTYQWTGTVVQPPNPGCSYPAFPGATTQDLNNLYPGEYCVTVMDADFCEVANYCITINQLPLPDPGVVNPVPIASTIECLIDAVPPTLPVVEDACGVVLQPGLNDPVITYTPDPLTCEGTVVYTYTYTSCLNQTFVWTYTYTVEHSTPPNQTTFPPTASTVECLVDAVPPTLPVVEDVCGVVLGSPVEVVVDDPDPLTCEGTRTYTYTWTDCAGLQFVWTYVYTIEHSTPPTQTTTPPTASTVECLFDAVPPTLPVVEDVCGVVLGPPTVVVVDDPDPLTCEGTRTYTYTWTDCAGLTFVWTYTYTIEHSTPPAEVGGPVPTASTVECLVDAVPPGLPVVEDVCSVVLTAPTPVITDNPDPLTCEGTRTYEYTYVDCAGLTFVWTYVYTIEHSTPPTQTTFPPTASTVECITVAIPPTLPVVEDVCGVTLTNPLLVEGGTYVDCEGTKTYTYTWTDCAGLTFEWTYTYTIERVTPPSEVGGPVPIASTVECQADAVPPTLPVVWDVCGNELPAPDPIVTNPVDCEGTFTYTYIYEDCAGLLFTWVYTYTIEHSTPPIEVGGPVPTSSTVPCIADAVDPGAGSGTPQNGFAGYFDPANWTLQTNGGTGSIDVTGAPATVALTGSNGGSNLLVDTDWEIVIAGGGTIDFDWNYITYDWGPQYDPFGYKIDGTFYQLTDNLGATTQMGSASVNVPTGSLFAMCIRSMDDGYGAAVDIIGNFVYTPTGNSLPIVEDVCGNVLTPTGPAISGTYNGCEGTRIYTYTYTDCAGLDFIWAYTYTIEVEDFVMPDDGGEIITCSDLLYTPTPPPVNDYCGYPITPIGPFVSPTPPCNGIVTYVWNYEDCEGNNHDWTYTFTIEDNIDPTITCPADVTVYMNDGCTAINVDLGTPIVGDNCDPNPLVTNDAVEPYPLGTTVVTWTVTDCAGNSATCTQNVTVEYNTFEGKLVYHNIGEFIPLPGNNYRPMDNVEITLYEDVALTIVKDVVTTDNNGYFEFPDLCATTYYVAVTNNNKLPGGVNTTDAGQMLLYSQFENHPVFGGNGIEPVRWLAGDVSVPYGITIGDVGNTVAHFVLGNVLAPFNHYWNYYWQSTDVSQLILNNLVGPVVPMSTTVTPANNTNTIVMFAQCTGDFNGNFAHQPGKSAGESLSLDYGKNMLVEANAEIELPVVAGMDMEVGAVSLIMNFPATQAEITGIYLTSNPSSPLQYNVNGNELRIGWYSLAPVWLEKGESLITLQLKLKGESAEGIQFSLANDPLNELADGDFNVVENASLIIDIPSTSALGIQNNLAADNVAFSNHPNPFKGTTTLTYDIPVDGQVVIEVYDLVGNLVKTVVNENQPAGAYTLQFRANDLQPGLYTAVLKLKSADDKVVTRAIKMINK